MAAASAYIPTKEGNMYASTDPTSSGPWWGAIITAAAMLGGAILKTFVDLVRSRDDGQAKWRAEIIEEVRQLRGWNQQQQDQLDRYQSRIVDLEKKVKGEQDLRHEIKGQLFTEQMQHALLKKEHAHILEQYEQTRHDLENLRVEYATVKTERDKLCVAYSKPSEPNPE